nr:hypothetical protein [Jiangella muralis]
MPDLEAERQRGRQVLAGEPAAVRQVAHGAVRPGHDDRQPDVSQPPTRVGHHELAARPQHARELGEHRPQVRDVRERQRAHDEVDGVVGQWQ